VTRIKILSSEQETDKRQVDWGCSGKDRVCYRQCQFAAADWRKGKGLGSEAGKMTDLIWAGSCRKKPAVTTCVLNFYITVHRALLWLNFGKNGPLQGVWVGGGVIFKLMFGGLHEKHAVQYGLEM